MKKVVLFFVCSFLLFSARYSSAQQVPVIKFSTLDSLLNLDNDTTYVINFWATWCKPCVAELPNLQKLKQNYFNKKLSVIFVSLDFKKDLHSRLESFVEKNKMQPPVFLLDEPNYNSWIDKVDPSWSGSIPATIIHKGKAVKFYEQEFTTYDELEKTLQLFTVE